LTPILIDFENHEYQADYYNSYLWKQLLFQSVNRYSGFVYLAVKLGTASSMSSEECLAKIRIPVSLIIIGLSIWNIGEVLVIAARVRFLVWYEAYQLKRQGKEAPDISFVEEQAKYQHNCDGEQIYHLMQLVLSLGFVLIFGAVAPIIIPLTLGVFFVHLRARAFFLTSSAKRTLPFKSHGIGAWLEAIDLLTRFGIIFQGFLFVCYGAAFAKSSLLARITGFLIWCLLTALAFTIVDAVFTSHEEETILLGKRRDYTLRKIQEACGTFSSPRRVEGFKRLYSPVSESEESHPVKDGDWGRIYRLDGSRIDRT
jgi:hypothetical protein